MSETRGYRVEIPTPSAKRLEARRRLVMQIVGDCFSGVRDEEQFWDIPPGLSSFDFVGPGELHRHDPTVLDGDWDMRFCVEYSNSTGSRKERIRVDPVPLEGCRASS